MEDFGIWLTLGHWLCCPCVEVFGLCLTLALRNHFGLVEQMVDQYKTRKESYEDFQPIDATCHITQHADPRDKANWSRQKATGHKQVR